MRPNGVARVRCSSRWSGLAAAARLGGLGLLPRTDNASIQDFPFAKKVDWYSQHNTLLAVLSRNYEHKHPTLNRLRTSHGLKSTLRAFKPSAPMEEVNESGVS